MSKITINQIKKLREEVGAPIMECKKALQACRGNVNKAREWLKKREMVRVEKKKDRAVKEGLIHCYIHVDKKVGAMIKIGCESDFVARNKAFAKLAHEVCLQIASMKPKNVKELMSQEYIRDPQRTIADLINEAIAKFGENIKVKELVRLEI